MKPTARLRSFFAIAGSLVLAAPLTDAATYTWANSNITATPTSPLDWFTGGPNTQGTWTGGDPVSNNTNTIQFFQDNTTSLTNIGNPNTQVVNLNNGSAFELGTLTLSGRASTTTSAKLIMTLQGDALNFSAATGTINLDATNVDVNRTITYNVNNNIQLGTASSGSVLTFTGGGTGTFNFGGTITELQVGGGSIVKNGSSTLILSQPAGYTGSTTINAGTLTMAGGTTGTTVFSGPITLATGAILNYSGGGFSLAADTGVITSGNITLSGGAGTATIALSGTQTKFTINGTVTGQSGVNQTLAIVQGGYTTNTGERQDLSFANTIADGGSGGKLSLLVNFTRASTAGQNAFVNLTGQNTFTGDLTVNNPMQLNGAGGSGGFQYNGAWVTIGADRNKSSATWPSGTGYLGAGADYSGNITINTGNGTSGTGLTTLAFLTSANQILRGVISGGGSLYNDGSGTVSLFGANTFAGTTTVAAGKIIMENVLALQNSAYVTTGSNGSTIGLDVTNGVSSNTLRLGGLSGSVDLASAITAGYTGSVSSLILNPQSGYSVTYSGAIADGTGAMSLTKNGAGTQALSGAASSYTGATIINAGILDVTTFAAINTNSSIGKGSAGGSAADLVINGGTLRHSAANVATTNRLFSIGTSGGTIDSSGSGTNTLSFTGTGSIGFNGQTGARTLTLTGSNTGSNTMASLIADDGSSNATSLAKTGAGTWILTNANTYSGTTTVAGGTLTLTGANLYTGTTTVSGAGTLTLDFTGGSNRIKSGNALALSGGTLNLLNLGTNTQTLGTTTLGAGTANLITRGAGYTSGVSDLGTMSSSGGTVDVKNLTASPTWIKSSGNLSQAYLLNGSVTANNFSSLVATDASGNLVTVATTDYASNATINVNPITDARLISTGGLGSGASGSNVFLPVGTTDIGTLVNAYTSGTQIVDVTNNGASLGNILRMGSTGIISSSAGGALQIGISVANGGVLTAGGAANTAGTLYLNNANAVTINSAISDNGSGAVSLIKSGAGTLTLSAANTFTGGLIVNGGNLTQATATDSLGALGSTVTFNGSSLLTLFSAANTLNKNFVINSGAVFSIKQGSNNATTITGAVSGAGSFAPTDAGGLEGRTITLQSLANTFTGQILFGTVSGSNHTIQVNSLVDTSSLGTGNIEITSGSGAEFMWGSGAVTPLVLNNRQFQISSTTAGAALTIKNNNAGIGNSITINSPLSVTSSGAKTVILTGGVAGQDNRFAGNISDGSGSVGVRAGSSFWTLSGTNTYSGITGPDNVTLTIRGKDALSPNSIISFDSTSGSAGAGSGRLNLFMDNSGTVNLGNQVDVKTAQTSGGVTAQWTINVGNNVGATTGSTLVLGKMNFASIADPRAGGYILNVTGSNGYGLRMGNVDLANNVGSAGGTGSGSFQPGQGFNPTTAPLTITGTVRQNATSVASGTYATQFVLWGTAAGNQISGNIMNPADFGSNVNAKALNLYKGSTGDWTLSGTNTYTGGTTIATGKLQFNGANSLPTTGTVAVGAAGHLSLADGTARNQTVSALTLASGAVLSFDWANGASSGDQLTSTAAVATTAGNNFAINMNVISGTPTGSLTVLTGGAGSSLDNANYYLANATNYTATITKAATTVSVGSYTSQTALPVAYWQGNKVTGGSVAGVDSAWALSTGSVSNWSTQNGTYNATALTPGSSTNVVFSNSLTGRTQSTVLGADVTVNSLTIDDSTAGVTIAGANGAALTLMSTSSTAGTAASPGSAISVTSNVNGTTGPTISSRVILGSNQTWNVANGKTLTIGGEVSGSNSLSIAGGGSTAKVILNAANTFTGNIAVSAGTLQIGTNAVANGANLSGGIYSGNILLSNNASLDFQTDASTTISGVISGDGNLLKRYIGTLTLSGANTYTGKTTIGSLSNAGSPTLAVYSINSFENGSAVMASSSLGAPNSAANAEIQLGQGNSSPNPTLLYLGTGETTNRVINISYNGGAQRTLDASGTGPLKFTANFTGSGASTPSGVLMLQGSGYGELAGNIPDFYAGAKISKSGTGTWTLSGTNGYTGATTVSAGTLIARSASALGITSTANVSITAGAALNYFAASDTALGIGGTLTINGGTGTTIGGSIGSTATSARIDVAGNALVPTAAVAVNVYGVSGVSRLAGTNTYTLISGLGGGATTLNNGTYTLGSVFNNTDFTVSNITKSTTALMIDVTKQTALTAAYFKSNGYGSMPTTWAASNGSTASNWAVNAGSAVQALVPGSAADVTVGNASNATSTVLGADMSINSLTISDNTSNFALNADGYGLTIGAGGITKNNTTTRTATIASNIVLGSAQQWSNSDTGNALVVSGNVTGANNLTVTGAGNTIISGRLMTGAGTLTKNGNGTLTVSNHNTYTGTTTVSAGTLVVNGNISTSSLTTVASAATLGGIGTLGAITIDGRLAPGNSIGTITATGDVTWNDNVDWAFELGLADADLTAASNGSDNDLLNITGGTSDFLKGTGTSFTFDFNGGGADGWYKLVDWAGTSDFVAGDFAWTNLGSGLTGSFTVDSGTSALYLTVAPIPEPGAVFLGSMGLLLILRRRR